MESSCDKCKGPFDKPDALGRKVHLVLGKTLKEKAIQYWCTQCMQHRLGRIRSPRGG